jgi:CubicO group peptidase (beta-lactamase class C family)
MTTDHITPAQKAGSEIILEENCGWGVGMAVITRRDNLWDVPGRFGWDGGYGTSGYTDPQEEMVGILLTQRLLDDPSAPLNYLDFWTSAYQAIAD